MYFKLFTVCRIERDSETFPTAANHLGKHVENWFTWPFGREGKTPWRFRSDWVKKKSDKDRDSDGNLELTPISGRVRQKSKQHLSWEILKVSRKKYLPDQGPIASAPDCPLKTCDWKQFLIFCFCFFSLSNCFKRISLTWVLWSQQRGCTWWQKSPEFQYHRKP